ncbi:MAG TPA: nuclease [Patescibacteria group bacterium]|nr:nuclease [Patescibacteria group bacterium]
MRYALTLLLCLCLPHPAAAKDVIAGPLTGDVLEVLDGDTVTVRVHIWIGQDVETHVRINGIDTPEKRGKCVSERARAIEARDALAALLADGRIRLSNVQYEKYAGRVLATASASDGTAVADYLISRKLARPYSGGKRGGWCS